MLKIDLKHYFSNPKQHVDGGDTAVNGSREKNDIR